MSKLRSWLESRNTADKAVILLMIQGYFLLTLACLFILVLPFSQSQVTPFIDHLFFAVSIVSTTGLAPGDFSSTYNLFGQIMSLIFIQMGGVGYMALSSFVILKQSKRLPSLPARLLRLEFNLPERYPLVAFIYSVVIFTVLIEIIGAVLLYIGFQQAGVSDPIWQAIFHSISAFCTAGFSLFSDSMVGFQDNALITNTIVGLSLLGSIGFIVLLDFWFKLIGKRKRITLTSRIILFCTVLFPSLAAIMVFISDTTLRGMGWEGVQLAIFQSISAHTTVGFNNHDISQISVAGQFVMILLMVIGASPSGTGGGIKTTTVSALIAVLLSILKRKRHVTFFNREIPASNIYLAMSSAIFYGFILLVGTWILLMIDGSTLGLTPLLFEAASALSTVGISTGITGDLSVWAKVVICVLMFIGRLGVLTFGLALLSKAPLLRIKPQSEDIAI